MKNLPQIWENFKFLQTMSMDVERDALQQFEVVRPRQYHFLQINAQYRGSRFCLHIINSKFSCLFRMITTAHICFNKTL